MYNICYIIKIDHINRRKIRILELPPARIYVFFFLKDTATPEFYPLPLPDALPISPGADLRDRGRPPRPDPDPRRARAAADRQRARGARGPLPGSPADHRPRRHRRPPGARGAL